MIRPALYEWQLATDQLLALVKNVQENSRDETIEQIELLLDQREALQNAIVAPFTSEEEQLGRDLLSIEKELQTGLSLFTKRIRTNISEAQSKKDHMKNYVDPYRNVARDGTFYDTKQ